MANDDYAIDGHKLMLHPRRVADWLDGRVITPIYMEVSPSGTCNHRCLFCSLDFMGYQRRFLPEDLWEERVGELGALGVRAIMFAGEGEPFLHPHMADMATATQAAGIDIAFTTNGVMLVPHKSERILPITSWIKVSCNAGTPESYAKIHRSRTGDFARVLKNMTEAANIKQKNGYGCSLGMQMVILPENMGEAHRLATCAKDAGCDYLVLKPYSQHPLSKTHIYENIKYDAIAELEDSLRGLESDNFKIIVRSNAINKWNANQKSYKRCLALPFWAYIDSGANVWECSRFLGVDKWKSGNLAEESFADIFQGQRRRVNLEYGAKNMDASKCRLNCRMDNINFYLHELLAPSPHANFI